MRRILVALGVLFLLFAAAAAAAVIWRVEIATAALRHGLRRAGFPEAQFTVERLGLRELDVTAVEAGAALHADRIEVALDFWRLPELPIQRVRVIGARVDLAAPPAFHDTSGFSSAGTGPLPLALIPVLELEGASVTIPSAIGAVIVRLESRVYPEDEALRMNLDGKVESENGSATLQGEARLSQAGAVSMSMQVAALAARHPRLRVASGSGHLRLEGKASGLDLRNAKGQVELTLAGVETPERRIGSIFATAPLSIEKREGAWAAMLADADVRLPDQGVRLGGISGDLSAASGDLRLERIRIQDLKPLASVSGPSEGTIEASARLRWNPSTDLAASGSVKFSDASLNASDVRVVGLDGEVELASLLPLETAGVRDLRIREIRSGVSLTDATLGFALEPVAGTAGSRLRVERFATHFAGGRVVVEKAVLDPLAAENALEFRLEELDLESLFEIAAIEGVSGSGSLSGRVPVAVRGNAVEIRDGKLESEAGILRIRSAAGARMLTGQHQQSVGLLLDALRDFHYDALTMTVGKTFEGDTSVKLHLDGKNPAVLGGYPFRINMNLTGNLDRLVGSLCEIARLSDRAVRATVRAGRR